MVRLIGIIGAVAGAWLLVSLVIGIVLGKWLKMIGRHYPTPDEYARRRRR